MQQGAYHLWRRATEVELDPAQQVCPLHGAANASAATAAAAAASSADATAPRSSLSVGGTVAADTIDSAAALARPLTAETLPYDAFALILTGDILLSVADAAAVDAAAPTHATNLALCLLLLSLWRRRGSGTCRSGGKWRSNEAFAPNIIDARPGM